MDKQETFITTVDNPYDYFTEFDDWFAFDVEKGYNTCSFLARLANVSDVNSDEDNEAEIDRAIDEMIKYNVLGIYRKITKNNNNN